MTLPDACKEIEPYFKLSAEKLKEIVKYFREECEEGLLRYGEDVAMVPSFVPTVPTGSETGTFLALDLGGTNSRVCEVKLEGNHKFSQKQQKYRVSEDSKEGEARVLFNYIADSVDAFSTDFGSEIPMDENEPSHSGFTFSFPVEQTALDAGKLSTWTKGFAAKHAVGNDVVRSLQDAFDRKHMHVCCSALVNDTVGTSLSRSYQNGPASIGAIFGTGTNGAYIDKTNTIKKLGEEKIHKLEEGGADAGEYMVINTEWGAFDNRRRCSPVSIFDNKSDRESINPRKQTFEKMVSGMYLGEITRNISSYMIDSGESFEGYSTEVSNTHYGFDTSFVSYVEGAKDSAEVKKIIVNILKVKEKHISDRDAEIVLWACNMVASRASYLSACAMATVISHTEKNRRKEESKTIDVGVDGSVAQFLPGFEEKVREALRLIIGEECAKHITIGLAKDGSGVGAALAASTAKKAAETHKHRRMSK